MGEIDQKRNHFEVSKCGRGFLVRDAYEAFSGEGRRFDRVLAFSTLAELISWIADELNDAR